MPLIAFQGSLGAYSDLACRTVYAAFQTLPCLSFDDVFDALHECRADFAMLPIENSVAGRVSDVHYLLPTSGLHIIGEHYQPIIHNLLAPKGSSLKNIKYAESHIQALAQCKMWLRSHNILPRIHADTAGAAQDISNRDDQTIAAIASDLACEIYGLEAIARNIADGAHNTTRFLILSRDPMEPPVDKPCITTLICRLKHIPGALYNALSGFAEQKINILKVESCLTTEAFFPAQFYIDVKGHPRQATLKNALEKLVLYAEEVIILGTYPAHPFRGQNT